MAKSFRRKPGDIGKMLINVINGGRDPVKLVGLAGGQGCKTGKRNAEVKMNPAENLRFLLVVEMQVTGSDVDAGFNF